MAKLHLFAHMDRNFVKKGDMVVAYKTPIGTMGDGNGAYWAHLHHSISEGLTVKELLQYISGWSDTKVKKFYKDPMKENVDYDKMFGVNVDEGKRGYGFMDLVGYGFHPGIDINGFGGGNTDFGMRFTSSCSGKVIHEWRGWSKNGGWGNIIIVECI